MVMRVSRVVAAVALAAVSTGCGYPAQAGEVGVRSVVPEVWMLGRGWFRPVSVVTGQPARSGAATLTVRWL